MSDVLCVLKGLVCGDIYVHADGGILRLTQASGGEVKLSEGHAYALMAVSKEYFKFDRVLRPEPEPDPEPSEDTVALLCAAARKWAKWDARSKGPWSGGCNLEEADAHGRCVEKVAKWRERTLSYGYVLLRVPELPEEDPKWSPSLVAQMAADNVPPLAFNRILAPHAELSRLDTLVQQLCARVAVLEGNEPA